MSFTTSKNYYAILALPPPRWGAASHTSRADFAAELRRAYKAALLSAHPDKKRETRTDGNGGVQDKLGYTIDDVKEAYLVLATERSRAEYDNWLVRQGDTSDSTMAGGTNGAANGNMSAEFVLGLEVLDLADFEEVDGRDGKMEWTRGCRCGAERGFVISEEELEEVEARGDREVLVGCEGCSLWVRVGFEVEEG